MIYVQLFDTYFRVVMEKPKAKGDLFMWTDDEVERPKSDVSSYLSKDEKKSLQKVFKENISFQWPKTSLALRREAQTKKNVWAENKVLLMNLFGLVHDSLSSVSLSQTLHLLWLMTTKSFKSLHLQSFKKQKQSGK